MNRAGDGHDGLPISDQLIAIGVAARLTRIRQARLNGFVLLKITYILGRADEGGNHWAAKRRLTESLHRNTIAGLVQAGKVIGNLFPIDNRAIISGREAENRAR